MEGAVLSYRQPTVVMNIIQKRSAARRPTTFTVAYLDIISHNTKRPVKHLAICRGIAYDVARVSPSKPTTSLVFVLDCDLSALDQMYLINSVLLKPSVSLMYAYDSAYACSRGGHEVAGCEHDLSPTVHFHFSDCAAARLPAL